MATLTVQNLYNEQQSLLKLRCLCAESAAPKKKIPVPDINRPGLALAGFVEYFAHRRIQVMGLTEISFLRRQTSSARSRIFHQILSYGVPCFIISRDLPVPSELMAEARRTQTPVLRSKLMTTKLISELLLYMEDKLAPQRSIHGVLVDIYGIGVLILGKSGLGKSECALELVAHGHRLIADDVVDIKCTTDKTLIGSGPDLIKYHMEIRGLGIIDVRNLFGIRAVRDRIRIELVVQLEEWNERKTYDRLGLDEETYTVLGATISKMTIPIRPGRSVAVFLEVAAMNERLKKTGTSTPHELNRRLQQIMSGGKKDV